MKENIAKACAYAEAHGRLASFPKQGDGEPREQNWLDCLGGDFWDGNWTTEYPPDAFTFMAFKPYGRSSVFCLLSLMNFWTARWVSWKNSSMQSVPHLQNPEARLARVFRRVAANGMADMPIGNPALDVEAVGFRRTKNRHWLGVLITPWAVNLMLLPAIDACAPWPETPAGGTQIWRFPSGAYEFIVASDGELGVYHFCSIFSPPSSFVSQEAARQTAHALLSGLFMPFPPDAPTPGKDAPGKHRRAFLGLP